MQDSIFEQGFIFETYSTMNISLHLNNKLNIESAKNNSVRRHNLLPLKSKIIRRTTTEFIIAIHRDKVVNRRVHFSEH